MCVHVSVYICVRMYVFSLYVYVCMYVCMCMYVSVDVDVQPYVCKCTFELGKAKSRFVSVIYMCVRVCDIYMMYVCALSVTLLRLTVESETVATKTFVYGRSYAIGGIFQHR